MSTFLPRVDFPDATPADRRANALRGRRRRLNGNSNGSKHQKALAAKYEKIGWTNVSEDYESCSRFPAAVGMTQLIVEIDETV